MKIIILSPAYAPFGEVGAARMTSLSEYLVNQGNDVTVVCYSESYFPKDSLTRPVPEKVHIVPVRVNAAAKKTRKTFQEAVFRLLKKDQYDICISSVGPYISMYFLWKVKTAFHVPYIIDYRDPWLFENVDHTYDSMVLSLKVKIYNLMNIPFEFMCIRHAACAVSVTNQCNQDLIKRYPAYKGKFSVIFNGYEDMEETGNPAPDGDGIKIMIAGKLSYYNPLSSDMVFKAIKQLWDHTRHILLKHIGSEEEGVKTQILDNQLPVGLYCNTGLLCHRAAMEQLREADILLIIYAHKSGLGTKIFDYIALDKPILYVGVVPSELSLLVDSFDNGYVCNSCEDIVTAVEHIIETKADRLGCDDIKKYSREYQNGKYELLLKNITDGVRI